MTKVIDCFWKYCEFEESWDTSCGESFMVLDDTPSKNGMKYCPFCGGKLIELPDEKGGGDEETTEDKDN